MGKSTLIKGLLDELGYKLVIHYDKPKKLKAYDGDLEKYQRDLYSHMFAMIHIMNSLIFDRAHLGEWVYAPLYRGYQPTWLSDYERGVDTSGARLVLLTTSDFSFLQDDGLSLDFSRKEEEQAKFIEAFNNSSIEDKILIDVSNGRGGYKSPEAILNEVLKR